MAEVSSDPPLPRPSPAESDKLPVPEPPLPALADREGTPTLPEGSARKRRARRKGRRLDEPLVPSTPESERRTRRASISLSVLAFLAAMYTVYFARAILMPITAAVILALLFRPIIRRLRRYRLPDAISAAGLLLILLVGIATAAATLVAPAKEWVTNAPEQLREAGEKLHVVRREIHELTQATERVQRMAAGKDNESEPVTEAPFPFASAQNPPDPLPVSNADLGQRPSLAPATDTLAPTPAEGTDSETTAAEQLEEAAEELEEVEEPIAVEVKQPRLVAGFQLLSSTGTVVADLIIILVLTYFLMVSGDMLINNVLHLLPSMREKRNAVELVYKVQQGISSYLVTVTCINIALGVVVAVAMWLLGVPNPFLWGMMATVFNFVPFLGALVGVAVMFLVSVLAFESLSYALVPPLVYWALTAVEGNFVTPSLLGRSMSLNPIMVFLALTLLGWMWGIAGAVLAVPVLAVVKVGCDQFERSQPVGTLLGGGPTE